MWTHLDIMLYVHCLSFYNAVWVNHDICYFVVMDGMTTAGDWDRWHMAAQLCDEVENCNMQSGMTVEDCSNRQLWMNGWMYGSSPWFMMSMIMTFSGDTVRLKVRDESGLEYDSSPTSVNCIQNILTEEPGLKVWHCFLLFVQL